MIRGLMKSSSLVRRRLARFIEWAANVIMSIFTSCRKGQFHTDTQRRIQVNREADIGLG
jgi:hypothetical protein